MHSPLRYVVGLPTDEMSSLERMARDEWSSFDLTGQVVRVGALSVRASGLLVRGVRTWLVQAASVDVARKIELFRLDVREWTAPEEAVRGWQQLAIQPSGELLAGLVGSYHQVLLGTHRHSTPAWEEVGVASVLVEDLLLLKDQSGQQAAVQPDCDQPGTVLISRATETERAADNSLSLDTIRLV